MSEQAYNWTAVTDEQLRQHIVLKEKQYAQLLVMQQCLAQQKAEYIQAMKDELARGVTYVVDVCVGRGKYTQSVIGDKKHTFSNFP